MPAAPLPSPRTPPRYAMLGEARLLLNVLHMLPTLAFTQRIAQRSPLAPVMVLPGFGTGDAAMLPLRQFLQRKGFAAEGWGLGVNRAGLDRPHTLADLSPRWGQAHKSPYHGEGGVAHLCDLATQHVTRRATELGQPLALVGWSLGGTIAREVARDAPHAVSQVITLGTPVIGGPKYTAVAALLKAKGLDVDWIEAQAAQRNHRPIQRPITSIYSRSDAIVSWTAAIDTVSPQVNHIAVQAPHMGMGINPAIWALVVKALSQA